MGEVRTDGATAALLNRAFLSAPFETDGWDTALRALACHTGSARAQLIATGNGPNDVLFNHMTDAPSSRWADELIELGGCEDHINWRTRCLGKPLVVTGEDAYAEARRAIRSDLYDDFVTHYDMPHGCHAVLANEAGLFFALATLRTSKDGTSSHEQRAVFAASLPFANAAIGMQRALAHQGASLLASTFEAMDASVFVCDRRGHVRAMTAAAEKAAAAQSILRLDRGTLSVNRPGADRQFQAALGSILSGDRLMARLWLDGADGPLSGRLCEIYALPAREWDFGFAPRAIVTLRGPAEPGEQDRGLLVQMMGLSAAEADIALLAAKGLSRAEIASCRGASTETVNSQLKSLYQKADVRREGQLVALINKLLR